MDDLVLKLALLMSTYALGFAGFAYGPYAARRGWQVGAWFASGTSVIAILAILSMLGAPTVALAFLPWESSIVVVLVGFLVGFVLVRILKEHVQLLIIVVLLH